MALDEIRKKIDRIDAEILGLLNNRFEMALRTKNLKKDINDTKRETEIIARIMDRSSGLMRPEFSEKLFRAIIEESKNLQSKNLKLVGFQGEHGAYSEVAVRTFDPKCAPIPCNTFEEVFDGVENGSLEYGVVPVENSLGGSVDQVNDLLIERTLKIVAEINVPIHHCLLALPETDYREIKTVYSHPQALAQCRGFISRNKLEPRQFYDTAGAAKMIAKDSPITAAAIASKLCAEIYSLEVLKENIEDHGSNTTRFVVLSKNPSSESGSKCSIAFSTAHKPGALFNVLKLFYEAKVNLTRIESRPMSKDPGKAAFLVDFEGGSNEARITELLTKVKEETPSFKSLGFYKVK